MNSALNQFGNVEVIVVDDASSDGSGELLEEFGNQVKLIRMHENSGAPRSRNLGDKIFGGLLTRRSTDSRSDAQRGFSISHDPV